MLVPAGVVGYFLIAPDNGPIVFGLLAVGVVMFWVLFFMPTLCAFDLGTRGCLREVYGKANGCAQHGALKRDAIFAALRMRNPGQLVRVKWNEGSTPRGRTLGGASPPLPPSTSAERSNARKGVYDMVMLAVATVGSVAGVLALFLST